MKRTIIRGSEEYERAMELLTDYVNMAERSASGKYRLKCGINYLIYDLETKDLSVEPINVEDYE